MPRALLFAVAAIAFGAHGVHSQAVDLEPLKIRAYDMVGLPAAQLRVAEHVLVTMFSAAGIGIRWTPCPTRRAPSPTGSCSDVLHSRELVMRIAIAPRAERNPDVVGFAYVDSQTRRGTLGTVYADRVHTLARRRGADPGRILGRAMAHEVAHLLLGTDQHAANGIMRASFADRDHAMDWVFAADEAARMRVVMAASPDPGPELDVVSISMRADETVQSR